MLEDHSFQQRLDNFFSSGANFEMASNCNFYFAALGRAPSAQELSRQHNAFRQAADQGVPQLVAAAESLGQQLCDVDDPHSEYSERGRSDQEFVSDLCFAYLQRPSEEVLAIQRQFSMPGSDPRAEGEALYEYRLGLQEGLNFDWGQSKRSAWMSAKRKANRKLR